MFNFIGHPAVSELTTTISSTKRTTDIDMVEQFSTHIRPQHPIQDLGRSDNNSVNSNNDNSSSDSSANIGLPPVTYMARLIAAELLKTGASMFGRREDANCVLKVGTRKYYVHVQMLAVSCYWCCVYGL
jgi:hypothetical protein